jgi:hypothetical protein
VLLVAVLVTVVLAACIGVRVERRRRTPLELRGNWWPEFEREFRLYVSRLEQSRRPRERRNDHGSIGQ